MQPLLLPVLGLLITTSFANIKSNATDHCLNDSHARRVAHNFQALIHNYTAADADAYLTSNFTDYSDSVDELINSGCPNGSQPLGTATFTSLSAFKAGQGAQPGIPFHLLGIWHSCSAVTIRWRSSRPGTHVPEQEVTGIAVLETAFDRYNRTQPYRIQRVFSEFNSGAWLFDLGTFIPSCPASGSSNVTVGVNGSSTTANIISSAKTAKGRRARVRY